MECYICSIYFSLSHTVCSHLVEEKIKDAGYNKQEEYQSSTLCYAVGQVREGMAGAENNVGLVLEGQLVLSLWKSCTEEQDCPSSTEHQLEITHPDVTPNLHFVTWYSAEPVLC